MRWKLFLFACLANVDTTHQRKSGRGKRQADLHVRSHAAWLQTLADDRQLVKESCDSMVDLIQWPVSI
ncbi:hypothetical protein LSG31_13015 [Fodinisporobacter ferrooxydans]|uniref:Uncharacterized protein n=1 Tax=Fodinisporobacter ferrooxydans TaxID=2901836 RepID=A0ABY4CHJ3_9BACL|nr:hypothetical protein LSG31_13015 [Alicyclobacillaceae bacterium MYW30-H2]